MSERPRRVRAGANMAKLMMEEEEMDDFYKTAYGGFQDNETDGDYSTEQEQSDMVDTDFDVTEDENDEPESEETEEKKKRRTWEIKPPPRPKAKEKVEGEKKERKTQPTVVLQVSRRSTTTVKSEMSKVKREHEAKNRAKRKAVKRESGRCPRRKRLWRNVGSPKKRI